jgi:homoserine kinase type II
MTIVVPGWQHCRVDTAESLLAVLEREYGIAASGVRPVAEGTSTTNYRVESHVGPLFLKVYDSSSDLRQEERALALTRVAADHGVPTARLHRDRRGRLLSRGTVCLSVWDYLDSDPTPCGHSVEQLRVLGAVIGRLHAGLGTYPGLPAIRSTHHVPTVDVERARRRFLALSERTAHCAELSPARRDLLRTIVRQRLELVNGVVPLLEEMPPLTHQVGHGDLAAPNVLMKEDTVTALVDFRPPERRAVTYDLARIGLDPRTVLGQPNWIDGFVALLEAYADTNPFAQQADRQAAVRSWLAYVTCSAYPYSRLLDEPGSANQSLWQYGKDRHEAVLTVWKHLDDIESAVREGSNL